MEMHYCGVVDGEYKHLHYYGDSREHAEMIANVLKSTASKNGLNGDRIVVGRTLEIVDKPTNDDFIRWLTS
jgi:hypothetical protein